RTPPPETPPGGCWSSSVTGTTHRQFSTGPTPPSGALRLATWRASRRRTRKRWGHEMSRSNDEHHRRAPGRERIHPRLRGQEAVPRRDRAAPPVVIWEDGAVAVPRALCWKVTVLSRIVFVPLMPYLLRAALGLSDTLSEAPVIGIGEGGRQ